MSWLGKATKAGMSQGPYTLYYKKNLFLTISTFFVSFDSISESEKVDIHPHFPAEKTEAQRSQTTFTKSCGQLAAKT